MQARIVALALSEKDMRRYIELFHVDGEGFQSEDS